MIKRMGKLFYAPTSSSLAADASLIHFGALAPAKSGGEFNLTNR
jgi:hypothetical protein